MKWVQILPLLALLTACGLETPEVIEHREVLVHCPGANNNICFLDRYSIDVTNTKIKCQ